MQSEIRDDLITPTEKRLWAFLRGRYTGAEKAAPHATNIVWFNTLTGIELEDRKFRDLVASLVTVHKKPICTSASDGYFVARTWDEKAPAERTILSVIGNLYRRYKGRHEAKPLEEDEPQRQERLF
jgi:hypothetical protein